MGASTFGHALSIVLHHEGGYVNHPKDPGGSTNFGITQRTLDAVREKYPGAALPDSVKALDSEEVEFVYRTEYWAKIAGDELPPGLALIVFDTAVNQGVTRAANFLQWAAGTKVDGSIGPATIKTVRSRKESDVLREFAARRMHHYMTLDSLDDTFGLGWSRRLVDVFAKAWDLASK